MNSHRSATAAPDMAVSYYTVLTLLALAAVLVALIERGVILYVALAPVLIGLVGVVTRMASGPVAVVLTLGVCLYGFPDYGLVGPLRLADVMLCAAVLGYVAAQYRLQSLTGHVFPPDPRRREARPPWHRGFFRWLLRPPVVRQRRAGRLVTEKEIGALVLSLPAWAVLAQLCWRALPSEPGYHLGLTSPAWQAMLLTWVVGLGLFVTASLVAYWGRRNMTADEAALFLQDTLWRETRREQRVVNRWLAWARLRQGRRKGKT